MNGTHPLAPCCSRDYSVLSLRGDRGQMSASRGPSSVSMLSQRLHQLLPYVAFPPQVLERSQVPGAGASRSLHCGGEADAATEYMVYHGDTLVRLWPFLESEFQGFLKPCCLLDAVPGVTQVSWASVSPRELQARPQAWDVRSSEWESSGAQGFVTTESF